MGHAWLPVTWQRLRPLLPVLAAILALASWITTNAFEEKAQALTQQLGEARTLAILSAQLETLLGVANGGSLRLDSDIGPKVERLCSQNPPCSALIIIRSPPLDVNDPNLDDAKCRIKLAEEANGLLRSEPYSSPPRRAFAVRLRTLAYVNESLSQARRPSAEVTQSIETLQNGLASMEDVVAKLTADANRITSSPPKSGEACADFRRWRTAFPNPEKDEHFERALARLTIVVDAQLQQLSDAARSARTRAEIVRGVAMVLYVLAAILAILAKVTDRSSEVDDLSHG